MLSPFSFPSATEHDFGNFHFYKKLFIYLNFVFVFFCTAFCHSFAIPFAITLLSVWYSFVILFGISFAITLLFISMLLVFSLYSCGSVVSFLFHLLLTASVRFSDNSVCSFTSVLKRSE